MSISSDLSKKGTNVANIVESALKNKEALSEVMKGILSSKDALRSNSFKVLMLIAEDHADVLYPHWEYFEKLIYSDNTYLKFEGIYIIASLVKVDTLNRFEKIFDKYYSLFDDKSVIAAAHVAGISGKIANAKPELRSKITKILLGLDNTHHSAQRKELLAGYIIEAFTEYYDKAEEKERVRAFVTQHMKSKSIRTRRSAKEFLEKWGHATR